MPGLKDHCGRYQHVARGLVARGYAVHLFDPRGHGRSGGRRYYVERFAEYASDLGVLLTRASTASDPLFILAHSMGAVVACTAVIEGGIAPRGMVLTGAALLPGSSVSPLLVRLAPLLGEYLPTAPVVRLEVGAISRDPAVVRRVHNDPLTDHGPSPARTGYELLKAGRRVLERASEIGPPLLILHGEADRLTDPEGSRRLYAASREADLTIYPGLYHEILNEPERERVLGDILRWLDRRV